MTAFEREFSDLFDLTATTLHVAIANEKIALSAASEMTLIVGCVHSQRCRHLAECGQPRRADRRSLRRALIGDIENIDIQIVLRDD